jgi:hypothetical protein
LCGWIFAGLSGRIVDTKADVAARTDAPTAPTHFRRFITLQNKLGAPHELLNEVRTALDNFKPTKLTVQRPAAKARQVVQP